MRVGNIKFFGIAPFNPVISGEMKLTAQIYEFLKELEKFAYDLSVLDRVWGVFFPDAKNTWHQLHVNK